MMQSDPEAVVAPVPLPDTYRELELLLEALNALNQSLDHYLETEIQSVSE
jgi:hypothetical protein